MKATPLLLLASSFKTVTLEGILLAYNLYLACLLHVYISIYIHTKKSKRECLQHFQAQYLIKSSLHGEYL